MSIDEQIEAAWEKYVNDMDEGVRNTVAFHSDVFAEGYRAALRGLWIEVSPDGLVIGDTYHITVDNRSHEVTYHKRINYDSTSNTYGLLTGKGYFEAEKIDGVFNANKVKLVYRLNTPSPAEVFGEEVGDK